MRVIILGTTGMVGKGVLLECIEDKDIESVLVINRQTLGLTNPKVKEIIHNDFFNFTPVKESIKGYDACFFCMGVTSAGLNEEQYTKLTYELTLGFAKLTAEVNPNSTFCYVSGAGTDSTEKGGSMWARVKGKTENAIMALPFKASYMFRPGYIQPLKGVKSKTGWYNAFYIVLKPIYFLLKPLKGFVTNSVTLGKAMINAAKLGYEKKILESKDINLLGKK